MDIGKVHPGVYRQMVRLDEDVAAALNAAELPGLLVELVRIRVSQINGCAFCVDMHVEEARQAGETPQRLDLFPVWREAPYFSERERAALAWAESVTLLAQTHVPDEVFQEVRRHFEEKELVDLTMIVAAINAWNRLGVSFRSSPPPR